MEKSNSIIDLDVVEWENVPERGHVISFNLLYRWKYDKDGVPSPYQSRVVV